MNTDRIFKYTFVDLDRQSASVLNLAVKGTIAAFCTKDAVGVCIRLHHIYLFTNVRARLIEVLLPMN